MQSPGQPAVVQQVQVVQPKPDSQVVQIPQQALKVVQAASATLPPVPQRQSVPSSLQVTQTEPTPTQVSTQTRICCRPNISTRRILLFSKSNNMKLSSDTRGRCELHTSVNLFSPQILFKTASGEWQSIQLQDSVSTTTTPTTPVVTTSASPPASTKRTLAGGRKERTLAKIAPAGGIIALNTSQLSSAAQAVQTISINGVQVQGVPVTITNAGGEFTTRERPATESRSVGVLRRL